MDHHVIAMDGRIFSLTKETTHWECEECVFFKPTAEGTSRSCNMTAKVMDIPKVNGSIPCMSIVDKVWEEVKDE